MTLNTVLVGKENYCLHFVIDRGRIEGAVAVLGRSWFRDISLAFSKFQLVIVRWELNFPQADVCSY